MHRVHPPLQHAACRVVYPVASPAPSCSESRAPELPLALSGAPSRTPSPSSALLPWASWPWPPLTPSEAHTAAAALGVAPSPPPLRCLGTARLRRHNPSHAGPLVFPQRHHRPSPRPYSGAQAAVGSRWPDRPFLGRPWVSPLPCQPRPRLRHHACSRRRSTTALELADPSVLCDVRRRRKKKDRASK